MHLSRHAKNRLRGYRGLTRVAVEALVTDANAVEPDRDGRPRFRGNACGYVVTVVMALDNPGLIITIYANRDR